MRWIRGCGRLAGLAALSLTVDAAAGPATVATAADVTCDGALRRTTVPSQDAAASPASALDALLGGVDGLRAPGGLVATLTVLDGARAFPVLTGRQGEGRAAVAVAARAGKGRVVALGHDAFLGGAGLKHAGNARFLANAVRWMAGGGKQTPRVATLDEDAAADALRDAGFPVTTLRADELNARRLAAADVLIADPGAFDGAAGKARAAAVRQWVREGGGLLTYGVGWGWQQLHPDADLADDAGFNRLLVPLAGVGGDGGTADPTGDGGLFLADRAGLDAPALDAVLARLEARAKGAATVAPGEMAALGRTLAAALDVLPASDARYRPRIDALLARSGANGGVTPTKFSPVTLAQPLARLAARIEARRLWKTPVEQVKPHPAAASFPGAVAPEALRLHNRIVAVDTAVPDWHGTGLYAAPGEAITVTVPPGAAGKGLGVRIGAHKDTLWHKEEWLRFPEVTREWPLKTATARVANPFGGPVYVTVPNNAGVRKLGTVNVVISGAVAAPFYVKGKTGADEWDRALKGAPAPWAELQGERVILTVPAYAVRDLRDPKALLDYWDELGALAEDLYGAKKARPERFCVDIQISAGYMHAGYPIMTGDDVDRTFTNLRTLRGGDGQKTWGFYHELGHNYQRPEWTWAGMGEVTNNLLSLYGNEVLNGVKPDYANSHPAIAPDARRQRLQAYLARGASRDALHGDPFLTLTLFIQLRQAFGWEPFKKVFAEYAALPDADRPREEQAKYDQFLVRFSRATGRNLGPFLTAWGLPTTDAARRSVADLPAWMPEDWPGTK